MDSVSAVQLGIAGPLLLAILGVVAWLRVMVDRKDRQIERMRVEHDAFRDKVADRMVSALEGSSLAMKASNALTEELIRERQVEERVASRLREEREGGGT